MKEIAQHLDIEGLRVADLPRHAVCDLLVTGSLERDKVPTIGLAVHVAALEDRTDPNFVAALRGADLVYADGWSIELLARVYGAANIEAAPTTELGHDVLEALVERLERTPRVALLGGPPGLAERAGAELSRVHAVEVVYTEHGYAEDYTESLQRMRSTRPDVTFVGLGAPKEHVWVAAHKDILPHSLVMTCGGWFGFLAGEEVRAPRWVRSCRLEWLFRAGQSPRLIPRYWKGVRTLGLLLLGRASIAWRR